MVDISSVQQDSIVVQSLQNIGGSIVDASNNFFVNTSIMFMGNTTTSVIIQSSGIYTPSIELDGTNANVSINTTSLMLTTSTANLYIDVNEANFPGDVTVLGSILLTGSFVANGDNGNTGDVLVSDGTISYWSSAANNSTYAYGKTEGDLNVNSALTSNNASYLGGTAAANYVQNTDSRTLSGNLNFTGANNTISGNLTIASTGELIITNGAGIYANASFGNAGQVLTSDGTGVYWSTVSGGGGAGGFTNGQSISVNNFVITGGFTANSSNGTSGQVLTSNGSGLYWSSATVTTVASIETEITADGPLAWWKFNETSGTTITNYGSLGSNANLTLSGSWTLAAAKIVPSSSDSFAFCATSTSYAGTANNILGAPASGDHTLEAIVLLTNDGTNANRVISISDVGETAATNYQAGLMVTTAGELFDFWEYGSGTNVSADSNVLVRRGEPIHLVFVKNSTAKTVTFYVNGVKTNVVGYANEPTGGTTAYTRVGNNGTDTTSRFTVAHTAIYNKQLSDTRVLAHAKAAGLAYTPNYVTTSLASGSFGYNLIFGG